MRIPHSPQQIAHVELVFRALEGIRNKLELLSERSGADEDTGEEGDVVTVGGLADDLRDLIIEYQVSPCVEKYTLNGQLMSPTVLTAECDL